MNIALDTLLIGSVKPLGNKAVPSGIDKQPVSARQFLGKHGFEFDTQADLKNHGGAEKAVHHYAFEHYNNWAEDIGNNDRLSQAGAFGENLSTIGMTEKTVAIGDIFRLGSSLIEVSQGRQPCWKLNLRFGVKDMAQRVQKTGRSGWYYRVLEEGYVETGDHFILIDRRSPDWTLHRLWHILYVDMLNTEQLAAMAALEHLPDNWRRYANNRLKSGKVEEWSKRLNGNTEAL